MPKGSSWQSRSALTERFTPPTGSHSPTPSGYGWGGWARPPLSSAGGGCSHPRSSHRRSSFLPRHLSGCVLRTSATPGLRKNSSMIWNSTCVSSMGWPALSSTRRFSSSTKFAADERWPAGILPCIVPSLQSAHTAAERLHPGQQLTDAERLGHIVIGTDGQAADLILLLPLGAQDDNADLLIGAADGLAEREAIHARQHHVQNGRIAAGLLSPAEAVPLRRCRPPLPPFPPAAGSARSSRGCWLHPLQQVLVPSYPPFCCQISV